jgi:hypothetical protein
MARRMDSLIQSLVLIRLGQELGCESSLAVSIANGIDLIVRLASRFF